MTRLEDLQPTAAIRGILPEQAVTVVSVQWFGSEALELTYTGPTSPTNCFIVMTSRALQVVEHGRPWSFDGDGRLFRLVSEAHRIRLAHLFDPALAVHTSIVEPLPHQITSTSLSVMQSPGEISEANRLHWQSGKKSWTN